MQGQWMGRFAGTNQGDAILEIDEVGDHYEGRAYLWDDNHLYPGLTAWIRTRDKSGSFSLHLPIGAINPTNNEIIEGPAVAQRFPDITIPTHVETQWIRDGATISVNWKSSIGTEGTAELTRTNADRPSDIAPLAINGWDEFRRYFRDHSPFRYAYRGQANSAWRLRTSFHRTQRADLMRYLVVDVATLHGHLSSLTHHYFNLRDPIENGAFMNLIQHHGYPTPLLDWTFSPFIAAYFAFRRADPTQDNGKVRIFILDVEGWRTSFQQLQTMAPARPHFSIFAPIALNNNRMVPQQGLSSVTNLEDLETYIRSKEPKAGAYLQAVDLPVSERNHVLRELSTMGITPGSLFPGLDGACEQMKDRFFGFGG